MASERRRLRDPQQSVASDLTTLESVAQWIGRAQDAAGDGGISWGYHLRRGWAASYPETTGYLVPTLISLSESLGEPSLRDRAARSMRFLASVRLPSGAFPGLTVSENRTEPSVFNTAQILNGLLAWHRATGDAAALDHARAAGDWLLSVQEVDGSWRRHVHNNLAVSYTAHASCWIADLGTVTGDVRYLEAVSRHLDWVLAQQDPRTGWFDRAGFDANEHAARIAITHTIAYTIAGVLHSSLVLARADGVEAARRSSVALANLFDRLGWIPGVLDSAWQPRATHACLTGTAQIALIWLRFADLDDDPGAVARARRAVELLKRMQRLRGPAGVRGGIGGSSPIWGSYLPFSYPNWAAKFFADAVLDLAGRLDGPLRPAD